ncbi:hypothetical protein MBLNU459_g8552t1 [Dothideomycetes sp. NU459]
MSGYEVEHNIPEKKNDEPEPRPRRPDMSTFFSTLDLVDTSGRRQPQNEHAIPLPEDISAAFRTLANTYGMMLGGNGDARSVGANELLEQMQDMMIRASEDPPRQVKGVPDEFLAELERVPKKSLKPEDSCPICANPFLEDPHPLVVRLPCHDDHIFDLECITPWLKLNSTCPLDRKEMLKKKFVPPPPADDDEEEWDDMYA